MSPQLTVHNAQISTATVEIKTLTITGKQVTLAVFRQLVEEPLIADDGTLNGVPWGRVNYHPDKCADAAEHWHVVWQKGAELRRSRLSVEAVFPHDELFEGNPAFWPEEGDRLYAACVYHWLRSGQVAYWRGGLFKLFTGELTARISRYSEPSLIESRWAQSHYVNNHDEFTFTEEGTGLRIGISVAREARAAVLAEIEVREAEEKLNEALENGREHNDGYCSSCADCRMIKLAEARSKRDAELAALSEASVIAPVEELWGTYRDAVNVEAAHRKQYRDTEALRRERHLNVRKAIADLPQLFIAV